MEPEGVRFLLMRASERWFAVEVGQVETLRRRETLHPPPVDIPYLVGLLPLDGTPIPVVDLGTCLGLSPTPNRRDRLIVVSRLDAGLLAFLVQEVRGPVLIPWAQVRSLPPLLRRAQRRPVVWALVAYREDWIPALDLACVLSPTEVETLRGSARFTKGGSDDDAIAA